MMAPGNIPKGNTVRLGNVPRLLPGRHETLSDSVAALEVLGVAHDSRRVKPGWVFVAIRGEQRDGADFVDDALARGAVAIVAERPLKLSRTVPLFVVPDARRALAALASHFYGRPSRRLKVIGVTGTNGKTTTTFMLRSIVEAAGHRCGLMGTIMYDTGRRVLPASITTPESVDVQEFLAEMVAEGIEYAAMEVSSHALCMRRVDFVRFAAAVFTNISEEHMDYHRSMNAYMQAKSLLFRRLGPADAAVINASDPAGKFMAASTCARVVWYGRGKDVQISATIDRASLGGIEMTLNTPRGSADISLPLIGDHNVENAMAAAGAALALGLGLEAIRDGLRNMPPVPGRLEKVPCEKPVTVLVDYAHTDRALDAVLTGLRRFATKRILVVFGAGGDRDRTKRPRMGRVAERGADVVWVTSDNPRSEEPMAIIQEIVSGMKHRSRVRIQPDREVAIGEALHAAEPGDIVLIAGKGHERTQRFRDTVIPFDDREAVRRAFQRDSELSLMRA